MSNLLAELNTARTELARLQGVETTLREQFSQIPNGDVPAFLAEYNRRGDESVRLGGEVAALTTRAETAEGEVARLSAELAKKPAGGTEEEIQHRVENRAAEIVSNSGVPAAAAETAATSGAGEPANFESFRAEYSRLHAEDPVKGSAYYAQWFKKFNR